MGSAAVIKDLKLRHLNVRTRLALPLAVRAHQRARAAAEKHCETERHHCDELSQGRRAVADIKRLLAPAICSGEEAEGDMSTDVFSGSAPSRG